MTSEQSKDIVRCFLEASSRFDQQNMHDMMAQDFLAHLQAGVVNRSEFIQVKQHLASAFSNIKITVLDQVAEEDKVASKALWTAIHSGTFFGNNPSGKTVSIQTFSIDRVKNGKIIEHWDMFDNHTLMVQLGLLEFQDIFQ